MKLRTLFVSLFVALALVASALPAQTRKVEGFEYDATRPNLKQPKTWDLSQLHESAGTVPAAALAAGVAVSEGGFGGVHKTVLTLTDVSITMTDAAAAGTHGSLQLYDFPTGVFLLLGAVTDLSTAAGAGGLADTAAVVGALGSEALATDNATLTSAEADFVPSTAGTLSGGAGVLDGETTTALLAIWDGTGGAIDLYLNVAAPDAGSSADDTLTVSGTITLYWLELGDN